MCPESSPGIGIPVASLLTGRRWPVLLWPRHFIVTRRPVTCTEPCNRQPTCAGYVDLELQVPYRRRPPFSRAFATFAAGNLGNVVHDALVAEYLSHELVGHISRDSTAIVGREKPAKKAAKESKPPRKRGRPAKGEQRETATLKRLDRQVHQAAAEAIGELPTVCDRGTKQNAKGYKTSWNGYKLHLDTNDIGLPISALVTSALCMTARWLFL